MIHVIMGLKGSGKTKKLIDSINAAVAESNGSVVCIAYGSELNNVVTYKARLVDSKEYGIKSTEMLKGFVSGLHAGNFDITNVFIDNLYKTIGTDLTAAEEFVTWAAKFAADNSMEITVALSEDPANASEGMKQYM